jgi:hypothetical protein
MKITWKDILYPLIASAMIGFMVWSLIVDVVDLKLEENRTQITTTNAKPISQQPIGDEAEPDILIIYEAEVDGVRVYPNVIKEAE